MQMLMFRKKLVEKESRPTSYPKAGGRIMTLQLFGHNEEKNKMINYSTHFVLFCARICNFVFNHKHKHM